MIVPSAWRSTRLPPGFSMTVSAVFQGRSPGPVYKHLHPLAVRARLHAPPVREFLEHRPVRGPGQPPAVRKYRHPMPVAGDRCDSAVGMPRFARALGEGHFHGSVVCV